LLDTLDFSVGRTQNEAAVDDVVAGLGAWRFWTMLGWSDIRQRYRRSVLGPFWITLSMALMIGALSAIYGAIFQMPIAQYLPYLAAGLMTWLFVSTTINEGTTAFISAEGIIKQSSIPLTIYIYRVVWRNVLVLLHNLVVLVIIFPFVRPLSALDPLALACGLVLVMANLAVASLLLAALSTRYRDLPPIIASLTQVMFYVTPILYEPSQLPPKMQVIAHLNPFYHLIDVLRRPLTGEAPEAMSYVVSLGMLFSVGFVAFLFFRRFRGRIAYWL
jgi:homopolymeric O-antigen transport system permease protein